MPLRAERVCAPEKLPRRRPADVATTHASVRRGGHVQRRTRQRRGLLGSSTSFSATGKRAAPCKDRRSRGQDHRTFHGLNPKADSPNGAVLLGRWLVGSRRLLQHVACMQPHESAVSTGKKERRGTATCAIRQCQERPVQRVTWSGTRTLPRSPSRDHSVPSQIGHSNRAPRLNRARPRPS
jgi:hypothetical protein